MKHLPIATGILSLLLIASSNADETATPASAPVESCRAFLASLDDAARAKLVHPFDGEERLNWHFIPRARQGLPYAEMSDDQEARAIGVLKTLLSASGYDKVDTIRKLEIVLRDDMGQSPAFRDPDKYYFTLFGDVTEEGPWGFRYEGHHISLNWTFVAGNVIASTPQFLGANPAEVRVGSMEGTRALKVEEDLARELVRALEGEQLEQAWVSREAPRDILTAADRVAEPQDDVGVAYGALDEAQQGLLFSILEEVAGLQGRAVAQARLAAVRDAGLENLKFVWMGGREPGDPHYYRIQGPTFIFEYDNTQNNANHVHTVWRDFDGDFGRDLLAEHYEAHHRRGPTRTADVRDAD